MLILLLSYKWCLVWLDPVFSKEGASYEGQTLSSRVPGRIGAVCSTMSCTPTRTDRKHHHPFPMARAPERSLPLAKVIVAMKQSFSFMAVAAAVPQDGSGEGKQSPPARAHMDLSVSPWEERCICRSCDSHRESIGLCSTKSTLPCCWHFLWKALWLQRGHGCCKLTVGPGGSRLAQARASLCSKKLHRLWAPHCSDPSPHLPPPPAAVPEALLLEPQNPFPS